MAVNYIKYRVIFKDVNEKEYHVDIYGQYPSYNYPDPIILTAGENPLVIDEDDSKDFFAPIRTQTGNLTICTKIDPQDEMPDGGILDIADIMPNNNTDVYVAVKELYYPETEGLDPFWTPIWCGYLSCEVYNQDYTSLPENIQLPLISVLEAWKSLPYNFNASVMSISALIRRLIDATPLSPFNYPRYPSDCADFQSTLINTSIFVKKEEYENEENHVYKVVGVSFYEVLETICKFMGWTARENGVDLFFEKAQGYGLLDNTETRDMADMSWRGDNHQVVRQVGAKSVKVISNLEQFDVSMDIPEMPKSSPLYEQYQLIGPIGGIRYWVYFLPAISDIFYNNLVFRYFKGDILLGEDYSGDYSFSNKEVSDMDSVVTSCIPYANTLSCAYESWQYYSIDTKIYAGAILCKMEFDQSNEPDDMHYDAKDGLLVCLFPGAYDSIQSSNRSPIFEIRSIQAFASYDDGWFNLDAAFRYLYNSLIIVLNDNQCRLVMELQVGNRYWNGTTWVTTKSQFFPEQSIGGGSFKNNWNSDMDIDEVNGICIPTSYEESNVKKYVMGEMVLRIYPETKFNTQLIERQIAFNVFFEKLSIEYYPKKSTLKSDRSKNTYYAEIPEKFAEDKTIENNIASYNRNNPSPSLLYKGDGSAQLQTLTYNKADGTTEQRRPETDLLTRMEDYYSKPRTILDLQIEHIDDKQLPLLRLNGLGDGKVYLPLSESRDFYTKQSTIRCFELPYQEQAAES